ncbi:TPA: hypothetical protein L6A41_36100, partial [Pseudomonas aeruginosa]|nr:hypothetical protein [Pseudomonas aeruginosa]
TIQADDAAIEVGAFDIDGANASNTLVIQNSGNLISKDEAIDAFPFELGAVFLALHEHSFSSV